MRGMFFVIYGPSGGGKSSLVSLLLSRMGAQGLQRVVTYTTRKPGTKETNGADYHFICEEEFKSKIEQQFFLEWSTAYKAWYGTPKSILNELEEGCSYIAILDRNGAAAVKREYPASCLIWVHPPDISTLEQRLRARGRENNEAIEGRLELAQTELRIESDNPLFDYHVVNDTLTIAVTIVEKIVCEKIFSKKNN